MARTRTVIPPAPLVLDELAEYVERHRSALLAYVSRRMGRRLRTRVEAEDVVQEVTAAALRGLPGFARQRRDLFSWLCHLADRKIVDAHRRHFECQRRAADREVALEAEKLVAQLATPSQRFRRAELDGRVAAALDTLPADQRAAMILRYREGLGSPEIAALLGKSAGAVRVLLCRAVRRLQVLLA